MLGSVPISDEFVALCQAQLLLLAQTWGATSSAVYLTTESTQTPESELMPIATYPVAGDRSLPAAPIPSSGPPLPFSPSGSQGPTTQPSLGTPTELSIATDLPQSHLERATEPVESPLSPYQTVLPLMHQERVLGVLVVQRASQPWQAAEQTQLQAIANTLALARRLEQRGQWLDQYVQEQTQLRLGQQDAAHDLLHQFRNPLTALRTFGKVLLKRLQPQDSNHEIAHSIVRESDRLQGLLEQFSAVIDLDHRPPLLSASSVETLTVAGPESARSLPALAPAAPAALLADIGLGHHLHLQAIAIADILLPLLTSMAAIAQEQAIQIHYQSGASSQLWWADPQAIAEVLNNILENAVKYAPAGAAIYVETGLSKLSPESASHPRQPWLGVLIADTGPGIPVADCAHIFERHYRGVQAESGIPGTGLGLAIAHNLVTRLGGDIDVFSPLADCPWIVDHDELTHLSHGTAFVIWLPTVPPPATAVIATPAA